MLRNLSLLAATVLFAYPILGQVATTPQGKVKAEYGKLPLSFEANQGQADPQVRFTSRGNGYSLFLTDAAAVLSLSHSDGAEKKRTHGAIAESDVVRMELAGANPGTHVSGDSPLPGKANYFLGNDPTKWHTDVPTYAKVKYAGVYPGVDLVYYGNQRQLEYDFIVAPGADPKAIKLHFAGADKLRLTLEGDLSVVAAHGTVAFHKPMVYQMIEGKHVPVDGTFKISAENTVGFRLGTYDSNVPVVIDPVLAYSTYLGGTASDVGTGVAVDASGYIYVSGYSTSTNFPTTAASYQPTSKEPSGYHIAFVSKMDPTESTLLYSTYIGGTNGERALGITIDSTGAAYVTGYTYSSNFPVTVGAFQTANKLASQNLTNGFVLKLNATGSSLLYSTFIGGTGANGSGDFPLAIAIDSGGDAYITGYTFSGDFPITQGAYQSTNKAKTAGGSTGFVAKLNPTGTALVYSTYVGGSGNSKIVNGSDGTGEQSRSIAIDSSGSAYIAGVTGSLDFPVTSNAFQKVNNTIHNPAYPATTQGGYNGYVAKLNPSGSALVYATYLGGSSTNVPSVSRFDSDALTAIAIDSAGNAYVTGDSGSSDFPVTTGVAQSSNKEIGRGGFTATVTELNPSGSALIYSTYIGGTGLSSDAHGDEGDAITLDASGNAYITGYTYSSDFPVTASAFQTINNGTSHSQSNSFLTKLSPTGSLLYSSFLGGSGGDAGNAIAINSSGTVYMTGQTSSTDFPVTSGAYQTKNKSTSASTNAFVSQISLPVTATPTFSPAPGTYTSAQTVTLADTTSGASIYYTTNGTTPTTTSTKYAAAITVSSTQTIQAIAVATGYTNSPVASATYTINTVLPTVATPTFSPSPGTYTTSQSVTMSDATSGATIYYTTNGTIPTASSTRYTSPVTVSATETLSAIAIAPGYTNSPVATGVYTIATTTPDFSVVLSSSSLNVGLGKTGTETITLTPQGGFANAVTFSCSGLLTGASCSFSPASLTPSGASSTDTLTVAAPTTLVRNDRTMPFWPGGGSVVLATCCLLGMRRKRDFRWLAMMVGALALCASLTGCSLFGSSKSSGSSGNSSTSVVTVTATAGSLQHSTTFSLTVQ